MPAIIRLRKAIKALKRSYGLSVVRHERIDVQELPKVKKRKAGAVQGRLF